MWRVRYQTLCAAQNLVAFNYNYSCLCLLEVPGSNVNGGWEGNIRAIKWKDQEGTTHQGCKGSFLNKSCVIMQYDGINPTVGLK